MSKGGLLGSLTTTGIYQSDIASYKIIMYFQNYYLVAPTILLILYLISKWNFKKMRKYPMVVLGSGGHTTEMLDMLAKFSFEKVKEIVFIVAETDRTSAAKTVSHFEKAGIATPIKWITIPRSREVKQSYLTSIYTTAKSLLFSFWVILRSYRHIDILLTNGPGTCLPIVCIYWFLNILNLTRCRIVFVQSWCRVKSLSLTGKLIKPICHNFFVQWAALKQKYPSTTLISR